MTSLYGDCNDVLETNKKLGGYIPAIACSLCHLVNSIVFKIATETFSADYCDFFNLAHGNFSPILQRMCYVFPVIKEHSGNMLAGVLLQFHKLRHKCFGNFAYPPGSSSIFRENATIMDESCHFWTYNATWSNFFIF